MSPRFRLCHLPLAAFYAGMRALRRGDGSDEVHLNAIAKLEFERR